MEVRSFQPQDLYTIADRLQLAQIGLHSVLRENGYGESLAQAGPCFTVTNGDCIIACIGTIPQWKNYQRAWALVSHDAGRCMVSLTRRISRWLRFHNEGRVDTTVHCDFAQGIRWAEMLGFRNEGLMRHYDPDGRDCYLYAQVI